LELRAGARYFRFSRTVQTVCGTHPLSCSVGTGIPFRRKAGAPVTTDLPLPTLRMCGDVPLLPVYVSRAWTGTTSLFYFHCALLHYCSKGLFRRDSSPPICSMVGVYENAGDEVTP